MNTLPMNALPSGLVATQMKNLGSLEAMAKNMGRSSKIIKLGGWSLLLIDTDETSESAYHYGAPSSSYFIIGRVDNLSQLRLFASSFSSTAMSCSLSELMYLIDHHMGASFFRLLDGPFTIVKIDEKNDLTVISDSLGLKPVTAVWKNHVWITNELKHIAIAEGKDVFDFVDTAVVCQASFRADDYIPIKNATKLKPGTISVFRTDDGAFTNKFTSSYSEFGQMNETVIDHSTLTDFIHNVLSSSVQCAAKSSGVIGIPLSGGLDSSLITALAGKFSGNIRSFSIGTVHSDEFPYARRVSHNVGTSHSEHIIDDTDIINGLLESIYYNEIFDGLSAEIQSGLFNVYRIASGEVSAMLTGYGSDLIFGGILQAGANPGSVNPLLWQQVYRTRWTNELADNGALNYGIQLFHPFWTFRLINVCRSILPGFKVSQEEVKCILREYAGSLGILDREIVWRKKIGIHEGSSVNKAFANLIGVNIDDYKSKTRLTYNLYKDLITHKIKKCDIDYKLFKAYLE